MHSRRTFLKQAALASGTMILPEAILAKRISSLNKLRVGILGCGIRGQGHIGLLLGREDCEVAALCDVDEEMLARTQKLFERSNRTIPPIFTGSAYAWRDMFRKSKLDAVIIATPWEWHVPMAVAALEHDLYTGLEVGGGLSIEECWDLVRAEENGRGKLYFLENVCFRRDIMAIMRMVREGVFGELVHGQGGYQHDLREVKFNDGKQPYGGGVEFGEKGFSEARWRTIHSVHRNGELYPTHGLGPIATMFDINRGNRLVVLTSMASKSRGLSAYIATHEKGGRGHPNSQVRFTLGDIVTTMIQCQKGETIMLQHDTSLPRPYSLGFRVQGTKGLWMDVNQSIHIEGRSSAHRWEDADKWLDLYDHPIWNKHANDAKGAGHGGMDWFMMDSFVRHAREGNHPPFDVYDAAVWRVITPLSEQSIAEGGAPQLIPDFTSGRWMRRRPVFGYIEY